mmetsp:Transcript_7008/g.14367  ORF Transcript_7008/g.14367 Transcript_7008/m.14367 type:complete len:90 (-) Transcript_7008:706-975(-)
MAQAVQASHTVRNGECGESTGSRGHARLHLGGPHLGSSRNLRPHRASTSTPDPPASPHAAGSCAAAASAVDDPTDADASRPSDSVEGCS